MAESTALTSEGIAVSAETVGTMPWRPNDWGGLSRVLWHDACSGSVAGVLALGPAEVHTRHAHTDLTHHIWILSGALRIGDDMYGRGSYACMPAGAVHGPEQAGPEGCELFYVLAPSIASSPPPTL